MTVSVTYLPAQYDCDGMTTAFTFSFGVVASADVEVILRSSSGAETVLTETTHYSVAPSGSGYSAGGTVTTVSTYASGYTLTIRRDIDIEQESVFSEGMPTLYSTFEDTLDYLTMVCQQLKEQIGRSPSLAESSEYKDLSLPNPVSGYFLRWKNDLSGLENVTSIIANGATQATNGFYKSTMSGDEIVTVTGTWMTCVLDPNGADRNFDLSVPGDYLVTVYNMGPYLITFDQATLAYAIGSGEVKTFVYDSASSVWRG